VSIDLASELPRRCLTWPPPRSNTHLQCPPRPLWIRLSHGWSGSARPPFYRGRHPWRWLAWGLLYERRRLPVHAGALRRRLCPLPRGDPWTTCGGWAWPRWIPDRGGEGGLHFVASLDCRRCVAIACNASCLFLKAGLPKEEVKKERMGSQIQWRLPVFASTTSRSSHILTVSNDLSFVGCKHWRQYLASRCTSTTRERSDRWIETSRWRGNGEDKRFQAWADLPPAVGAVYFQ
jgi:hypothetical protein